MFQIITSVILPSRVCAPASMSWGNLSGSGALWQILGSLISAFLRGAQISRQLSSLESRTRRPASYLGRDVRALRNAGFHVILLSSPGPLLEITAARERVERIALPMQRSIAPFADLVALYRLWQLIGKCRPDLVEFSTPKAGLLGTFAAWLRGGAPARLHVARAQAGNYIGIQAPRFAGRGTTGGALRARGAVQQRKPACRSPRVAPSSCEQTALVR